MNWFKKKRIFLDYASATPVLPEVRKIMDKYWSKNFFNPSAIYQESLNVKKEVENARLRVARSLGVSSSNIIFTAGGTESDNLAILGAFEIAKKTFKKPHIIISATEHSAIFSAGEEVVRRGGEMSILKVSDEGHVSLEALKKLLKKNTFLVSVGLANNEIGTIEPISKIGRTVREYRKNNESEYPYLHSDASQAPSYLDVFLESLHLDLLTLDGAKIYGPKGVGVLVIKKNVKIHPIIFGGGQEGGLRSGTLNPALILGFAKALEVAKKDREKESKRLSILKKYFIDSVSKNLPTAVINGSVKNSLPNIINISLPETLSEFVVLKLDKSGVLASVGSACSADGKISGSQVIRAIGKPELSESSVRLSFGRYTTENEVKRAIKIFCSVAKSVVK